MDSSAIAGVHGKTTTTAIAGALAMALLPRATVLAGSAVAGFGGRSTWVGGQDFLIAETCEYRNHFLNFSPKRIILTSVEHDHQDFFPRYQDIELSFARFLASLPEGGLCVYCADDPGAASVALKLRETRKDLRFEPYGEGALGSYRISSIVQRSGALDFSIDRFPGKVFTLRVPGRHNVLNSVAALALVEDIFRKDRGFPFGDAELELARLAIEGFRGSKRRSELLGQAGGIVFMDDYAHHPTAIRTTLQGIRKFYPDRRIVVDFMSHTYSRTQALLADFAASFSDADELVLHKIYASAREAYSGGVTGRSLFELAKESHPRVRYFEEIMDAFPALAAELGEGDLFLSMGAGDNFRLAQALYAHFTAKDGGIR
jgi:UDP-N-acetylmuramate--alanine ligase